MYKVLITGDRSLDPISSFDLVMKLGSKILEKCVARGIDIHDVQLVTGDSATGIERAVRYLYADFTPLIVIQYPKDADGHTDFASGFRAVDVDAVVVLHSDPLTSRIAPAAIQVFGDKVHMPTPEALA